MIPPSRASIVLCATAVPALLSLAVAAASGSEIREARSPVSYGRDVRPILSDRCFTCHGPDPGKRQAGLRLDTFEGATAPRKTGAAIVPGDPEASLVLERVHAADLDERMPPVDSGRRAVTEAEREILRRWIEDGARYEPHWAFVAPIRPAVPAVRDAAWCRNPVDRFVLARLESEGVAPSPPAAKEVLARRVFLDLTGLPPMPEEIDAFLSDARADAFERLVDRLLTEEPYRSRHAERMAQPWLDAARYADTNGIHTDAGRQTWAWRDWILAAFRDGMPFDRFLTEQLAGDLLPEPTDESRTATGFLRNHVATDEGGAIAEEYLVEYAVDRTATTGSVFLGLTMGCARCHDHKYDPVSQSDFYSMLSFFDSVEEPGLYSQLPDPERAFEPFLALPRPEQRRERAALAADLSRARAELTRGTPGEDERRAQFFERIAAESSLVWETPEIVTAKSENGAVLTVQADGSILASGTNPDRDTFDLTLRTRGEGLRFVLLEALTDPSLAQSRVGRAENGNAVLTGVSVEAVRLDEPARAEHVELAWAWADHEQANGDFRVVNALESGDADGWAVQGHEREGPRAALFLSDRPFGFAGGTELHVRLEHASRYPRHVLGRVRIRVARANASILDRLPIALGTWNVVGPFPAESRADVYARAFGPESDAVLDPAREFEPGKLRWRANFELRDGVLNTLPSGSVATYVGRRVYSPSAREIPVSLGSDDGFRLYVAGTEVASREVDRGLAADQDRVTVPLPRGKSALILKDVNTGGEGGFYFRADPRPVEFVDELPGDLVAGILPADARWPDLESRVAVAWQLQRSPAAREARQRIASLEARAAALEAALPRTMVMKELAMQRPTYVLQRGQYDKPDLARPVTRAVPAALGKLADDAPKDRLGLARWMLDPANPLVARVAVNRIFELVFGTGIVRTSEDFGLQGEWPSHKELLDWLAVELRDCGWDSRAILRLLVTSSTYRQSSQRRPDLAERDPENRLLASFPRMRLSAEAIRDSALYVSGLLVEELGGKSVKPYQPEGLWQEVAMPASNTREYVRGMGSELWRRSLYTYWKRASPPPTLLTFDAPTRESCTIRRPSTNTPLQALALWNDPQFVEAARVLAERTLLESALDPVREGRAAGRTLDADETRIARLLRRVTGRGPDGGEIEAARTTLGELRTRYREAPEDATRLLSVGVAPVPAGLDPVELASWTLVASAALSLDAAITRN
ncbi:MAG: PSD1 and planctomycete cytochrome C domain-containing protein [Planctomycetota bacterium]|nr:PSD1 and planctomycete cytochrome C domain-containing protein [Planctomycetota bacterium]